VEWWSERRGEKRRKTRKKRMNRRRGTEGDGGR
jgi:hypothetical protein